MSELQDTTAFSPDGRLLLGLLYLFPVIATVIGTPSGTGTSSRSGR
jgi:uncharacterized membrane protein